MASRIYQKMPIDPRHRAEGPESTAEPEQHPCAKSSCSSSWLPVDSQQCLEANVVDSVGTHYVSREFPLLLLLLCWSGLRALGSRLCARMENSRRRPYNCCGRPAQVFVCETKLKTRFARPPCMFCEPSAKPTERTAATAAIMSQRVDNRRTQTFEF